MKTKEYNLVTLKAIHSLGREITFKIVAHSGIPSYVIIDGKKCGRCHLNTTTAFNKFLEKINNF